MKNVILVLLVLISSCLFNNSMGQAASVPTTRADQALENNFLVQIEMLSDQQLDLFQEKSKQQIQDWVDLVDLLSSKEWDTPLKDKLQKQAISLFSSPTDYLLLLENKQLKKVSLKDYLKNLKTQTTPSTISNIELSARTIIEEDYIWTLTFDLEKQDISKTKCMATFVLQKKEKTFGKEVKEVWDVLLLEIRELSN